MAEVCVSEKHSTRRGVDLRWSPAGSVLTSRQCTRSHTSVAQEVAQPYHVVGDIFGSTSVLPCGLRADRRDAHARGLAVERSGIVADEP
jgi:hypothetical protein